MAYTTENSEYSFIVLFVVSHSDRNMGKSHLLAKIFPAIARQQYQAHIATLDVRNPTQTVPHLLHLACGLLGSTFDSYNTAYQTWLTRPKTVNIHSLFSLWSRIQIEIWEKATCSQKYFPPLLGNSIRLI